MSDISRVCVLFFFSAFVLPSTLISILAFVVPPISPLYPPPPLLGFTPSTLPAPTLVQLSFPLVHQVHDVSVRGGGHVLGEHQRDKSGEEVWSLSGYKFLW